MPDQPLAVVKAAACLEALPAESRGGHAEPVLTMANACKASQMIATGWHASGNLR